tara:strand:+ start:159 stop:476 length:318 start_codon:yes stop_codon:yes gene_type:complete
MPIKKGSLKILTRISIWLFYLLSGYFLYSENLILPIFLGTFAKLVYPLSIFWVQIRIKNKEPWLPFTDSMSTSQLWFRLIPILASLLTFIIVSINLSLKVFLILT